MNLFDKSLNHLFRNNELLWQLALSFLAGGSVATSVEFGAGVEFWSEVILDWVGVDVILV